MPTVSGNSVLQDEENIVEPENDVLGNGEEEKIDLEDEGYTTTLPSEEIIFSFPENISLSNEQFETLISKQEEINQNIKIHTTMVCLLLGVLIGIIFVRGFGKFVRGV